MPVALPSATVETIKALFVQGIGTGAISRQTGVKHGTVRGYVCRLGLVELRNRTQQAIEASGKTGIALSTARDIAVESTRLREQLSEELLSQTKLLNQAPARTVRDLANNPERQGRAAVVKTIVEAAAKVHGWDAQGQANVQVNILNKIVPIDRSKQEQEAKPDVEVVPQE